MKLTKEEIVRVEDDSPLELFKQGIRSKETLDKYTRTLQQITCKILEEVLEGTFEERVQQLVDMGREDPGWMRDMLVKLSGKLRERTELPKDHDDYLNPDSIGNYFKPVKKLLDMNDVVISWKKIYITYPERDNVPESRGWTRDEIAKMLRHAHGPMERALVLVLASSGMRAGGLDLNWDDLTPIYRTGDGGLTLDPGPDDAVACAVLRVYRGSPERYLAFITPEAFGALQEYGHTWTKMRRHMPRPEDPIFLVQSGAHKNASIKILRDRVTRMATKAGLRGPKQSKRFDVPIMNGFRRFWNKTCKEAASGESALASLIKKEYMMGHRGLVALDQNYFKTNLMELAVEYVKVVPDLTIDDSERLRRSNRAMAENIQRMESEKDAKIERLEGQVRSMEEKMSEIGDRDGARADELLDAILRSPRSGGVPADVLESFTGMMRQLGAAQEDEIRKMRAEYDAKIDGLVRTIERMSKEGNPGRGPPAETEGGAAEGDMRGPGPHRRDPF